MHDQDLQARVVIEMRVACRDDKFVMCVLQLGQLFRYAECVMVINQSDGSRRDRVGLGGLLGDKPFADEISKGLGAIGVAAFGERPVKSLQKIRIERDADSAQNTHLCSRKP